MAMGDFSRNFRIGAARGLGFLSVLLIGTALTFLFAQGAENLRTFQSGQVVGATDINNNFQALNVGLQSANLEIIKGAPDGLVAAFNLSACPTGWIAADGTNGTPDLRGAFARGMDDFGTAAGAAGRDPAGTRALANYQADAFQGHYHHAYNYSGAGGPGAARFFEVMAWSIGGQQVDNVRGPRPGGYGSVRVDWETRPKNIALLFCMRKR